MDYRLTAEQHHWCSCARTYTQREVTPRAAELDAQVDPAAAFSWELVEAANDANPFDPEMAAAPKFIASETAFEVTRHSLEIFGASGVMRETGTEKLLRDATIFLHSDGTNTIMRKKIATDLQNRTDEQLEDLWDWWGVSLDLDSQALVLDEVVVTGSPVCKPGEIGQALELAAQRRIEPVIGARFSLEKVVEAYCVMQSSGAFGQIVVDVGG